MKNTLRALASAFAFALALAAPAVFAQSSSTFVLAKMDSEVVDQTPNEPLTVADIQKMESAKLLGLAPKTMVASKARPTGVQLVALTTASIR